MKKIFFIVLIFIVSVPLIISLFHPGFFKTDDGEWMIIRFSAFHQALRDGQFPVRFLGRLNYGYGYPVANFLYPGFMYLSEPIKLLGFSFVNTIKIILGLSLIGSAVFAFLWLSKIFDKFSALLGAVFYIYLPYHLFDIYKRGSVGEILALGIVPFVLWMIERKNLFLTAAGIMLLIISHNTLALLFLPVIFVYSLIRSNIKVTLKSFIFGFLMSSFFLIPAIIELSYTNFSQIQISNFESYFADFNLIGISSFVVFIVAVILMMVKRKFNNLALFFVVLSFLSILFSLPLSLSLWKFIPSSFIQFPFRFLSYLVLSIAFLSAFIISRFSGIKRHIVAVIFITLLSYSSFLYIKPNEFFNKGDSFYSTNEGTTTVKDEYLPKWVKVKPTEHFKQKAELLSAGEISNLTYNSKNISFTIASSNNSIVRINTIYYPGWNASIDGEQSIIEYKNKFGVMDFSVPKGQHSVQLSFSETPLRLFSDFLSVVSLLALFFVLKFKKDASSE